MKKLVYLLFIILALGCSSSDNQENSCQFETTLVTSAVSDITNSSAILNGSINLDSGNCDLPNNTKQGFVYAKTIQPTISDNKVNINSTETSAVIETLEPSTTYYVRTFISYNSEVLYGNQVVFDTKDPCDFDPDEYEVTLLTSTVTDIIEISATFNGTIQIVPDNCALPANTKQGFVWATTIQPTINDNRMDVNGINVSTSIPNLEPDTTYYVRTFYTNYLGEFYGNEVSFKTEPCVYQTTLATLEATDVMTTFAILHGTISFDTGNCDLPENTEQGFVYATTPLPNVNNNKIIVTGTEVSTAIENLEPNTIYYARTFVSFDTEEYYGNQITIDNNPLYLDANGITIKALEWAEVGDVGTVNGVDYTVVDLVTLENMIYNNEDVSKVCTSKITSMLNIFAGKGGFNQDIGTWDVSNVTNMEKMFDSCYAFNQDIGAWDVSNATNMKSMFNGSNSGTAFNQDIGAWDVSGVTNMFGMFANNTSFNLNISAWDVSSVTNMESTFYNNSAFNQDISTWNVSGVTNMKYMFSANTAFNQDIGAWDVSSVINMQEMFKQNSNFNQDIGAWNVSNVINMIEMFANNTSFNQNIGTWNVSSVTNMQRMFFNNEIFNQPIGNWDVSSVTNMERMFRGNNSTTSFNQDLSNWDVSNVTTCWEFYYNYQSPWVLPKPNFTSCDPN